MLFDTYLFVALSIVQNSSCYYLLTLRLIYLRGKIYHQLISSYYLLSQGCQLPIISNGSKRKEAPEPECQCNKGKDIRNIKTAKKHATPGIRWWSPTQLHLGTYLWEGGRDPELSHELWSQVQGMPNMEALGPRKTGCSRTSASVLLPT